MCDDILNKYLNSTIDAKSKLALLLHNVEKRITELERIIFLEEKTDSLTSFVKNGLKLIEQTDTIEKEMLDLESNVLQTIPLADAIAEQIVPIVLQLENLRGTLEVAKHEEIISRYRSEVDAARVLGLLDMSLEAFTKLSYELGTHVKSTFPTIPRLPAYYYAMLEHFCRQFRDTLTTMGLPRIKPSPNWLEEGFANVDDRCPWDDEILRNFCLLYGTLSDIRPSVEDTSTDAAKRAQLSLPLRIILEPLEKRFLFNFYGNRITNRPEKPEWYFTEVLTWIGINDQWLTWIQDEQLKLSSSSTSNLRIEFMRGLISFVMDKISYDLRILKDPPRPRCPDTFANTNVDQRQKPKEGLLESAPPYFGHLADEVLAFEQRLDDLCYHSNALRPVDLFTHRVDVLKHWLHLESEAAHARLRDILLKPYAWVVENKVPQCVGDCAVLVHAISRRGSQLRHNAAKPRAFFFKIQLDLLFTFLGRLSQLLPWNADVSSADIGDAGASSATVNWTSVLNAMHAVIETMQTWSNDQYFVELWEDRDTRNLLTHSWDLWLEDTPEPQETHSSLETRGWQTISQRIKSALAAVPNHRDDRSRCPGVFTEMSGLYQSAIDQALEKVSVGIFSSLQRLAQAYLQADRQQWTRTAPGGGGGTIADVAGLSLSSGATELFMQLSHNMAVTAKELHPRLFRQLWRPLLGQQLDDLLYRKLILRNRFTQLGAAQLNFDLNHCLRALLAPYSGVLVPTQASTEDLLGECMDSCRLLTLPIGSAQLLLSQTLSSSGGGDDALLGSLVELGVKRLTPEEALDVLSRRILSD